MGGKLNQGQPAVSKKELKGYFNRHKNAARLTFEVGKTILKSNDINQLFIKDNFCNFSRNIIDNFLYFSYDFREK